MSQDHHHNQSASDRLLFPESPPPLQQASPSNDPLQNTVEGSNSNNNKRSRWVQRAVDTLLQNAETSNIDNVFLENYIALMDLYDSKCQAIERTVEETCVNLVTKAKVPGDAVDTGREDDGVEMRRLKGEFVNAMEVLQNNDGFHMRKGNLPKCATDVFKTWFHEHIDNPCKYFRCPKRELGYMES